MARWICVRTPFNYHWPDRSAVTHFATPGDQFVKDEVADFAVEKGYATEGKADASSRSSKSKRRRSKRESAPAKAADDGPAKVVGNQDDADADRPADGRSVDGDAS